MSGDVRTLGMEVFGGDGKGWWMVGDGSSFGVRHPKREKGWGIWLEGCTGGSD